MTLTHISTKQELARWTREHADAPGINWTTEAGPGGTLIITEHDLAGPVTAARSDVPAPARA